MNFAEKQYTRAELEAQGAIFAFAGEARWLSNFARSDVSAYGLTFPTVEHAFAAAKLDPNGGVFTRAEVMAEMARIAAMSSPGEAKRAGRRRQWDGLQPGEDRPAAMRPFMRPDWDSVKETLILELLRRKFTNPALRAKLLATGDALIVEGNNHGDRLWGMVEVAGIFRGRNMLGEMLSQVRREIRAQMT